MKAFITPEEAAEVTRLRLVYETHTGRAIAIMRAEGWTAESTPRIGAADKIAGEAMMRLKEIYGIEGVLP
jgi:hypothetical protein